MTSPDSVLAGLAHFEDLRSAGLRFSVLAPDEDGTLRPYRVQLTDDAATGIAGIAEQTRARLLDATLLEYDAAATVPRSHAMYLRAEAAATLIDTQRLVDLGDSDAFDADADYADRATMLAARFSTAAGASITFYRVSEALLRFSKRRVFGLVYRDGVYDALTRADVLLMKPTFDVVVSDGVAVFAAKSAFERAFGFLDELERTSAETFDRVTTALRIRGSHELRDAATRNPQMMAMMASIKRSMDDDPGYAASMTMPRLIGYVRAHPDVGIPIETTQDGEALVFEPSPTTRFRILNLLNDNYLKSDLTSREYEATSKVVRRA